MIALTLVNRVTVISLTLLLIVVMCNTSQGGVMLARTASFGLIPDFSYSSNDSLFLGYRKMF